jgi:predicted GIY-YIG superfamily endonuclease
MATKLYWVYLLESESRPGHHYTGFSEDPDDRLRYHNSGAVPATAAYRPWRLKTILGFTDREQALAFERYLKSHSGRAFAMKRL